MTVCEMLRRPFGTLTTGESDQDAATKLTTTHRESGSCWMMKQLGAVAHAVRGPTVAVEVQLEVPNGGGPQVVDARVFRDNVHVQLSGNGRNPKAVSDGEAVLRTAEVDSLFAVRGLGCIELDNLSREFDFEFWCHTDAKLWNDE
mmetsp:Transcript_79898/g.183078  ORF Transcript_79898/g.183078 Transcript_79898/m.183078 type:complete len:145 (+) Transcript_79898:182-616(+)